MCLSCPAIRSSGAATRRLAVKIAMAAIGNVKPASAINRIMTLRWIEARKSAAGITVTTIQLSNFSGEKVTK